MFTFTKFRLHELFTITKIVTILYYEFSKNYSFPGEQHNFWEFIYVDKGEILITADTNEYILRSGEMAFHKPNEFHSVRSNGFVAPNVAVVSFECTSIQMRYYENKILFLNEHEKYLLSEILKEGQAAFELLSHKPPVTGMKRRKNPPIGSEHLIKLYLELLLINIIRRRDSIYKRERYTKSPQKHLYAELTSDIISIFENNLHASITLSELSNTLGISVSQLKKVFKAQTGNSVLDFFLQMKIKEAKRLIREDNLNFTQIADKLGYGSIHYFSRSFKLKTGMTPTEYSTSIKM
jgi:AraC-like DNA-binding protein